MFWNSVGFTSENIVKYCSYLCCHMEKNKFFIFLEETINQGKESNIDWSFAYGNIRTVIYLWFTNYYWYSENMFFHYCTCSDICNKIFNYTILCYHRENIILHYSYLSSLSCVKIYSTRLKILELQTQNTLPR